MSCPFALVNEPLGALMVPPLGLKPTATSASGVPEVERIVTVRVLDPPTDRLVELATRVDSVAETGGWVTLNVGLDADMLMFPSKF